MDLIAPIYCTEDGLCKGVGYIQNKFNYSVGVIVSPLSHMQCKCKELSTGKLVMF